MSSLRGRILREELLLQAHRAERQCETISCMLPA